MARAALKAKPPARRPGWLPPVDDPRREAVLLAAFDVFMEHGYERATMLEIATRAKVSKLTLYALFKDKEGLFEALVSWGSARYQLDAEALGADEDPIAAITRYAISFARVMLRWQSMALFRIAVSQAHARPHVAQLHAELTRRERQANLRRLARDLAKAGHISTNDIDEFMDHFIALMRGELFYEVLAGQAPPPAKADVERHAKRAITRLLKAYAPAPARARKRPS